jgi:hypothetical protein
MSSSSTPPTTSTLSTLDRLQHGLPLERRHRVFDEKLLEVNILRDVVNTWLSATADNDKKDAVMIDACTISFAFMDTRFAWSLYHLIEIK